MVRAWFETAQAEARGSKSAFQRWHISLPGA